LYDHKSLSVFFYRIVVDGPGSLTVFNGLVFMNDLTYTRSNKYIAGT